MDELKLYTLPIIVYFHAIYGEFLVILMLIHGILCAINQRKVLTSDRIRVEAKKKINVWIVVAVSVLADYAIYRFIGDVNHKVAAIVVAFYCVAYVKYIIILLEVSQVPIPPILIKTASYLDLIDSQELIKILDELREQKERDEDLRREAHNIMQVLNTEAEDFYEWKKQRDEKEIDEDPKKEISEEE